MASGSDSNYRRTRQRTQSDDGIEPSTPRKRQRVQSNSREDPSTPQGGSPSKKRLANIPKQVVEKKCKDLRRLISSKFNDDEMRDDLDFIWLVVREVLEQDPKLKRHLVSKEEFYDNVTRKGEKTFLESLRAMAANCDMRGYKAWEDLFEDRDEVFLKKETQAPDVDHLPTNTFSEDPGATERAWQRTFSGDSAMLLLDTISSYLDKERDPYSRQASIVNSSGTGKSRMVDQLATQIITVPMCLRPDPSTGYPPSDTTLRSWLLSGEISDKTLDTVRRRLHGFVYALLTVTRTTLVRIDSESKKGKITKSNDVKRRQANLASTFRDRMTENQSYQGPNAYRESFYKKVTQLADEFMEGSHQKDTKDPAELRPYVSKDGYGIEDAGKLLADFIDRGKLLDSKEGFPRRPLIIFAFDEAHILTDNPPTKNRATKWNLFSELRRVLRQTSNQAIFSLFLSTAGRFNLFSPEISSDPSRRIQNCSLSTLDPITEISFDDLAYDAPEYKIMLEQVVDVDWMCHLGRPLFASIYDATMKQYRSKIELMDLAKVKLLDGPPTLENNRSGSLACLSMRFALEFNMDGTAGDVARTQVERHMRLCLAATAGRDTLVTLAGSEPLLAEAAYELMRKTKSNPVHHLAHHSDLNCVDRGRRGELVAALLIMQACDAARAESDQRWVPVDLFMEELLPRAAYNTLKKSLPTFYRDGEMKGFAATFKDYGIWFNHVIKVEEHKMFSADHLWKYITRGAVIMCSNNQKGVDIVIPICHIQQPLSRESVTAILVQVKNADEYQLTIDKTLFDAMNPIVLGLFPNTNKLKVVPKPVIRIVFALASLEAGVNFPKARQREHHHPDKFTAFDVWCAGLGDKVFKHVTVDGDLASYRLLLERSLRPHEAFNLQDDEKGPNGPEHDMTRRLRGSHRRRMAPLTTHNDAHHAIHLKGLASAA